MAVKVEAGAYVNQAGVLSHNRLHDLELLWWVGWASSFYYAISSPSNFETLRCQQHMESVQEMWRDFNNRANPLGDVIHSLAQIYLPA